MHRVNDMCNFVTPTTFQIVNNSMCILSIRKSCHVCLFVSNILHFTIECGLIWRKITCFFDFWMGYVSFSDVLYYKTWVCNFIWMVRRWKGMDWKYCLVQLLMYSGILDLYFGNVRVIEYFVWKSETKIFHCRLNLSLSVKTIRNVYIKKIITLQIDRTSTKIFWCTIN